ncbi:MAG: hypothetical protein J7L15_02915 [Clostridiales bacterium]|nr:hypothetical protein [Clostridiales bacterium]
MAKGFEDWAVVAQEKKGKGSAGKDDYLWLKSGNKYRVRPIHKTVHFWKYFHRDDQNRLRTAITEDPDTCPIAATHAGLREKASERYAIYVIDRADGKLKIMEGPKSVFMPFRKRWEVSGKSPGGSVDGGDWQIEIVGSGKNTSYTSTYVEDTPLTAEELAIIQDAMKDGNSRLLDIYDDHTPEEIEKRLFSDWETKGGNNAVASGNDFSTPSVKTVQETVTPVSNLDLDW